MFFLQHLLADVFLSTQTRHPALSALAEEPDRDALERVIIHGTTGNLELTRGLLFFLNTHLARADQRRLAGTGAADARARRLAWAVKTATDVLQVGAAQGGAE